MIRKKKLIYDDQKIKRFSRNQVKTSGLIDGFVYLFVSIYSVNVSSKP